MHSIGIKGSVLQQTERSVGRCNNGRYSSEVASASITVSQWRMSATAKIRNSGRSQQQSSNRSHSDCKLYTRISLS